MLPFLSINLYIFQILSVTHPFYVCIILSLSHNALPSSGSHVACNVDVDHTSSRLFVYGRMYGQDGSVYGCMWTTTSF